MPSGSGKRQSPWKILAWILAIALLPVASGAAGTATAGDKAGLLRTVMSRIDDMRLAMAKEKERVVRMDDFVGVRRSHLAAETHQRLQALNIDALDQAVKDDRLRFDLRLLGHLAAYEEALGERIAFFEFGARQLSFFYAQAGDDLEMVQLFSDPGVDELIADVTRVLERCRRAMDTPLMEAGRTAAVPLERIWKKIAPDKSSR